MKASALLFVVTTLLIVSPVMAQFTPANQQVAAEAYNQRVADINGDGLDDLIDNATVQLGLGGGKFAAPVQVISGGQAIYAVLDYDGDGLADLITGETAPVMPPYLVTTTPSGPVFHLYRANGTGGFVHVGVLPLAGFPHPADFDGDGKDDLVMFVSALEDVMIHASFYHSNGDGTFTLTDKKDFGRDIVSGSPQSEGSARLAVGDLNGDGIPDLALRTEDDLLLFFGRGNGKFDQVSRFLPYSLLGGQQLAIVDADGDGNADLVFAKHNDLLVVMLGNGKGNFPRMTSYTLPEREAGDQEGGNFAVGTFTSSKPEIAVTTDKGTLIILSVENGVLKESSRTSTSFHMPVKVLAGSFNRAVSRDLLVTGCTVGHRDGPYRGEAFLAPQHSATGQPVARSPRRLRPSAPTAPLQTFDVSLAGGCATYNERWSLAPEGVFRNDASSRSGVGRRLEAVYLDGAYYFRITPDGTNPNVPSARGVFADAGGIFIGGAFGVDACGRAAVFQVEARREQ